MPTEKEKLPPQKKHFSLDIISQMLTLATSALGLVAALAWNSFIQEVVNNYIKKLIPGNSGLISLFIYAILVTILAVIITFQLTEIKEKLEK